MGIAKTIKETAFRLKLRKQLGNCPLEELMITYEEVNREINRRNKKK